MVLAALAMFIAQNGLQVAAVDANPRASRLLLHTMLVGSAASVACPVWYASAVASPSHAIIYFYLTGFVVTLAPFVSFAAWALATAERRSCERAAQGIIFGASLSLTAVSFAGATAFYVTLSDQVSGFAGVAINGKEWLPHTRDRTQQLLTEQTRVGLGEPGHAQAWCGRFSSSRFESSCCVSFDPRCLAPRSTSPESWCCSSKS